MKNLLLIFGIVLLLQTGDKPEKILKLDISVSQIELDEAKNMYVVEGPKVSMYTPAGDLEYSYSNMYTIRIHSIDVSNPEKILLFYKLDQKIALLTQYFRTIPTPFMLKEKGYHNISLACMSSDDNIWMFDNEAQLLIKVSDQGGFITQSKPMTEALSQKINPSFMLDYNGEIFVSDPLTGILIFNQIGEHIKTIPLKGIVHFRIENDCMYFSLGDFAKSYNLKTNEEKTWKMNLRQYKTATIDIQEEILMMYVADPNKVDVLKMPAVNN